MSNGPTKIRNAASKCAILFEPLYPDVVPPGRATAQSAGFDLRAYLEGRSVALSDGVRQWHVDSQAVDGLWGVDIPPGAMALIPLGFRARLPDGFEAQIRPRSGATFKRGLLIPNAPGTVDADYPEEWLVPVRNGTAAVLRIAHGERIAQAVFHRYAVLEWETGLVSATTERTSGFGSTGAD